MVAHNWLHMQLEWDLAWGWQLCGDSEILHYTESAVEDDGLQGPNVWWRDSVCYKFTLHLLFHMFIVPIWKWTWECILSLTISTSFHAKPYTNVTEKEVVMTIQHLLMYALQHCCTFNHLVGWAGTCKLRAKTSSERLPKKCLAEKNISLLLDESPR